MNLGTFLRVLLGGVTLLTMFSVSGQSDSIKQLQKDNEEILEWMENLYEHGISATEDSIFINEESLRLMNDESYRNTIYPTIYTWEMTTRFLSSQELKKAFWYMINLYSVNDQNKNLVIKSVLTYNKLFKMDEVLEATYKTYALTDPAIGTFHDGKSDITNPHILEKKLNSLKEILYFIEKYNDANN